MKCQVTLGLCSIIAAQQLHCAKHRSQIKALLIFRNCVQSYDVCFDDLDTRPKAITEALVMKLNLSIVSNIHVKLIFDFLSLVPVILVATVA